MVRELYERGPLRVCDLRPQYGPDSQRNVGTDLRRAALLGLVTLPGKAGGQPTYSLTEQGVAFAEGRLRAVSVPGEPNGRTGRPKGTRLTLRPSWTAALGPLNTKGME